MFRIINLCIIGWSVYDIYKMTNSFKSNNKKQYDRMPISQFLKIDDPVEFEKQIKKQMNK
jgi:hypothetical protein